MSIMYSRLPNGKLAVSLGFSECFSFWPFPVRVFPLCVMTDVFRRPLRMYKVFEKKAEVKDSEARRPRPVIESEKQVVVSAEVVAHTGLRSYRREHFRRLLPVP